MHIVIKTDVSAPLKQVKQGFSRELFLKLNPPFPPVKLLRFDGCQAGDQVLLELNFVFFKQTWKSDITQEKETADNWFFVDVGTKLPFFLQKWRHLHQVKVRDKDQSTIIDDIQFTTGTKITDLIMYPLLYLQFIYRKPIYRKFFRM